MSVTGLFAGIGGFELAFSQADYETRVLAEIDPAARAVLRERFPNARVRIDVLKLARLPADTTIVTAGFPCQNLSMAGDKSGIEGPKSGSIRKMFELLQQSQVPLVVIENVYFMLQLDSGRAMRWMVQQFESLGYQWAYRVLDTMGFGLPQRRRRVYFVASQTLDPRRVLFADDQTPDPPGKPDLSQPIGFYWTEGKSGVGLTLDGIPPLKVGSSLGIISAPAVLFPDGEVLMPSITACERLQGFPAGWTDIAYARDTKRNARWAMVGNAVSVPAARWLAKRIKRPGQVLSFDEGSFDNIKSWPDAAWNVGNGRVRVKAGDKPIAARLLSINDFRDETWSRLSRRALDGFISRAEGGGLKMPNGFLDALRKAPRKDQRSA